MGQIFKTIDQYTSEKSLTTEVQTSIEKCRSSNFNENLMKIRKKIRKSKFQNSEKNKVWGLTQEISVPHFKRI